MHNETTGSEKFGVRVASRIANATIAAGEKLDASIGCTKEKAQSFKDSAYRLVDGGWSELRDRAGQIPKVSLFLGLGAGFCLGWFIHHFTSARRALQ